MEKRHWSNRLWDRSAPTSVIYSQTNNPGDPYMTDTDLILYKPKNKSSAGDGSIPHDNDQVCSQCGQNHDHKLTGGSAIQDMISFLNRDTSE
jgi:hypothetical protein